MSTMRQARDLERLGFAEFDAARYARAEEAFRLAAIAAPESEDAWLGLGASLAKQARFEEAAMVYGMAAIAAPTDAWPPLLAAEAWLAGGEPSKARDALEYVREMDKCGSASIDQLEVARALEVQVRRGEQ